MRHGLILLQAGKWYEAHEWLEQALWNRLPLSQEKLFVQALIQLAVAAYHAQRHNRVGAQRLAARAQFKLQGFQALFPTGVFGLTYSSIGLPIVTGVSPDTYGNSSSREQPFN